MNDDKELSSTPPPTTTTRKRTTRNYHVWAFRYPRMFAFIGGVVLPLLGLLLVAYGLGFWLAAIESPEEWANNDKVVSDIYYIEKYRSMIVTIVAKVPTYCYDTFVQDHLHSFEGNSTTGSADIDASSTALDQLFDTVNELHDKLPKNEKSIQTKNSKRFGSKKHNFDTETLLEEIQTIVDTVNTLQNNFQSNIRQNDKIVPQDTESVGTDSIVEQQLFSSSSSSSSALFPSSSKQTASTNSSSSSATAAVAGTTSNLYKHMESCSEMFQPLVETLLQRSEHHASTVGTVEFNWNRCVNATKLHEGYTIIELSRPTKQSEFYTQSWTNDQQKIYNQLQQQADATTSSNKNNATLFMQDTDWFQSIRDATGSGGCTPNAAATAFFWFTVMTSVGYGNAVPETSAGHAMVFTLGFLSLLAFAAILGTSGYIIVLIWDDFVFRIRYKLNISYSHIIKLKIFQPIWSCFIWGLAWYLYMIIVAIFSQYWWKHNMGLDVDFDDSYWFSYISTTTIGFGDYYPQPEGLFFTDVFIFSLLFLIGFTFASGFLGKFGDVLTDFAHYHAGSGLEQRLKQQQAKLKLLKKQQQQQQAQQGNDDGCSNNINNVCSFDDEEQAPPITTKAKLDNTEQLIQQFQALTSLSNNNNNNNEDAAASTTASSLRKQEEILHQLLHNVQDKLTSNNNNDDE